MTPAGPLRTSALSGAAFAGMFSFGIVMALLGAILPLLSRSLAFDLARAGDLFLSMNAAMLTVTVGAGPLFDRYGFKPSLIAAPALVAVALLRIASAAAYTDLLAGVVLLGLGGGVLNAATNTLIADLHADPARKNAALNFLGIFFGFGALFLPFTIGSLLETLGLATILYAALALSLIPAGLSVALAFPPAKQSAGVPRAEYLRLARHPLVLAYAFLLFFESGNEFLLGGYLSTFLTRESGASVSTASYLLAAWWGALMLCRIALSRLLLRVRGQILIATGAVGVAASVALLLLAPPAVAPAAVVILGLAISPIFPTVLGLAGARFPDHSGTVFGILIAVALCGGMTIPWAAGHLAQSFSLRAALALAAVNALAILALLGLSERRS